MSVPPRHDELPPDFYKLPRLRRRHPGWEIENVHEIGYYAWRRPTDSSVELVAGNTIDDLHLKIVAKEEQGEGSGS